MATTKFHLDKRATRRDGKFPLKISIAHKGKTSLISLDIFLLPEQWDGRAEKIIGVQNRLSLNTFITKRKLDVETALLIEAALGIESGFWLKMKVPSHQYQIFMPHGLHKKKEAMILPKSSLPHSQDYSYITPPVGVNQTQHLTSAAPCPHIR